MRISEDIYQFAGMGCTETNFSGLTYSGGIDVNLNTLKVFDETMREELASRGTFSRTEFLDRDDLVPVEAYIRQMTTTAVKIL